MLCQWANCRASYCRTHIPVRGRAHPNRGSCLGCINARIVAPIFLCTGGPTPITLHGSRQTQLGMQLRYTPRFAPRNEAEQRRAKQKSKASLAKHGQGREGQPRSATCFAGSFAREGQDREAYRSYASRGP